MRVIPVDCGRRAGKPARERLMFDVVQVGSYLHRHDCLLVSLIQARTWGSKGRAGLELIQAGPRGPGRRRPDTASYCAFAVALGQETRDCRSKSNRTDAGSSLILGTAILGASARYDS